MKLITNQGRRILFFFSSSLREARTRADEIRSPFSSFLSLFFFSFTPPVSFGKDVEQYASQAPSVSSRVRLHSSSSAPPPFRYVSRDPQKTSTPRTRNLISFSRLVTATTPRAGILRPTNLLFFQRERRRKGNVQRESPSQKPPSDNVFSPAIILPFRFVIFAPPLLETNLYIRRRNSGQKEKERNKVFWKRRVSVKKYRKVSFACNSSGGK